MTVFPGPRSMSNGLTPCCSRPRYDDPMVFDETGCRFGVYSRCCSCHRLFGEAKLIYTAPKGLRESWTALSEVAVREHHKPHEGRPLRFVMSTAGLYPLGYKPAQMEIETAEVEPPF